MSVPISKLASFILLLLPAPSSATPLTPRIIQPIGFIDPSTDEWSSTLSGIGPLILLIGDRTTKQVLRNIRGLPSAFSLAASPLGLLSIVTSLIRFCGTQRLRAFIGYELEARTVAGIEVTRVNCAGVSAHLTDGYVVRTIAANPASVLVAVSLLEGKEKRLRDEAINRVRAVEEFGKEKRRRGMPEGVANVDWCLHVTSCGAVDLAFLVAVVTTLADALGVRSDSKEIRALLDKLSHSLGVSDSNGRVGEDETGRIFTAQSLSTSYSGLKSLKSASTFNPIRSNEKEIAEVQITERNLSVSDRQEDFWNFSFMTTFDAVSEFTTNSPPSSYSVTGIGIISCLSILAVHILVLWSNNWTMSIGWILVMIGYGGIVFGVLLAAMLINSATTSITLGTRSGNPSLWKEGMVVSVKNTDSMDTTGSSLVACPSGLPNLEAVWIKSSTRNERSLASLITLTLVSAFLAHYLGLRAIRWWASIGELSICILAAFARSVSNELQPRFEEVKGVKIDKRCSSTGLIQVQSAKLVEKTSRLSLDARAYSLKLLDNGPTAGEQAAYHTARLAFNNNKVYDLVLKLTGLHLQIIRDNQPEGTRAILISFKGGIIVKDGLASPATHVALAFRSRISDLAAPTSLLARGILRQPEWTLEKDKLTGIPLGNVYIFALSSMLEWWTLSEDRNDMGDLQRNLHWPFFLVNVAFFVSLMKLGKEDDEVLSGVKEVFGEIGNGDEKAAAEVVEFLEKWKE